LAGSIRIKKGNPWIDTYRFRDFFVLLMTFISQNIFQAAVFFYTASSIPAIMRQKKVALFFLGIGLAANLSACLGRYYHAWPMLPLYTGMYLLPLCIGVILFLTNLKNKQWTTMLPLLICLLSLVALFFPKDYYLPFLMSSTIFSYIFFVSGIIGRSFFFIAAIKALQALIAARKRGKGNNPVPDAGTAGWVIWGFVFWTISMFAGGIWSYLGWGSPVVWEDPAITTTMATWFYYTCFLHLYLRRVWNLNKRLIFASTGGILVFVLNCYPELGIFRIPDLTWLIL